MNLPKPPYYAVIFRSRFDTDDESGYAMAAARMAELAGHQPGYLGITSVRDADGNGSTVSYWESEVEITGWRENAEHIAARERGRGRWYAEHFVEVAKVERAYGGQRS